MAAMLCLLLSWFPAMPQDPGGHAFTVLGPSLAWHPRALVVGPKPWGRPQAPLSSYEKLQKGELSAYSHSTRRSTAVVKHQL